MSNTIRLILTVGGLGLLRPAPGTWGSLPPVLLALFMATMQVDAWMLNTTLVLMALAASIACVRFGALGEQIFGTKDASEIVVDEVAGQCVVLLFLPWRAPTDSAAWMWNIGLAGGAFAAFRFFDILKPPPIRSFEKWSLGWGVLVDDLIAGVYGLLVVQGVLLVLSLNHASVL